MFGRIFSAVSSAIGAISPLSFHRLFAKPTVPGRKAPRQNRRAGTPVPSSHHFNWQDFCGYRSGRPAWTYRGARRNAMKNPAMKNTRKAVA